MLEPGIARADYEVLDKDKKIGTVTSGTLSPTLNKAIAIILVDQKFSGDADKRLRHRIGDRPHAGT